MGRDKNIEDMRINEHWKERALKAEARLDKEIDFHRDVLLKRIDGLEARLEAVREMEVPTGYSAKFKHGWWVCLQTVKAMLEDK